MPLLLLIAAGAAGAATATGTIGCCFPQLFQKGDKEKGSPLARQIEAFDRRLERIGKSTQVATKRVKKAAKKSEDAAIRTKTATSDVRVAAEVIQDTSTKLQQVIKTAETIPSQLDKTFEHVIHQHQQIFEPIQMEVSQLKDTLQKQESVITILTGECETLTEEVVTLREENKAYRGIITEQSSSIRELKTMTECYAKGLKFFQAQAQSKNTNSCAETAVANSSMIASNQSFQQGAH